MADSGLSGAFADENLQSSFYLGREYDLATRTVLEQRVDYESKDLVTHGVVVGMTGSGKTGLCLSLLEEAAIDGVPCIIIDPKGDLSNLLLQFPNLAPEDFLQWVNPIEAEQKGVTPEEYARQLAERWEKGLLESGQTKKRIADLRARSEYRIYTPGSEAGLPLSILANFKAPQGNILREDLNQKIDATASALLGLTGLSKDPVQSREHTLIANLILNAWTTGRDLDLHQLIVQIQDPPVRQIGALDVDTFYKEKDRLKLAVSLNNILASPSFSTWLRGDPLELTGLLGSGPKARQLIFSVAHLDDAQRMFFVTLLLTEVLSWTRKQSGTTNLRAILYFDEIFGYLPPHPGNPPTKQPLMTLFKQARAFGVGVLLATQNPVDIDYKALSNAGTWFVGKLQTERDKARLLEGLEGAAAERGARANRTHLEKTISSLTNRIFLLHNVHRGGEPKVFQTRWALSYLRGPMTREEIAKLMDPVKQGKEPIVSATPGPAATAAPAPAPPAPAPVTAPPAPTSPPPAAKPTSAAASVPTAQPAPASPAPAPPTPTPLAAPPPTVSTPAPAPAPTAPAPTQPVPAGLPTTAAPLVLPSEMPQFYLPVKQPNPGGATLVYQSLLLGWADVTGEDKKMGRKYVRPIRLLALAPAAGESVDWTKAAPMDDALDPRAQPDARWMALPESINAIKKVKALEKEFADYLTGFKVTVPSNARLNMSCEASEMPDAFRVRCQAAAWKEFEKKLAKERETYAPEFKRYQVDVPADAPPDPSASWADRWQPFLRGSLVQRSTPPASLSAKEKTQLENLESEWHDVRATTAENWKQAAEQIGELTLTPKKSDVKVTKFGLAWVPFWMSAGAATQADLIQAYR